VFWLGVLRFLLFCQANKGTHSNEKNSMFGAFTLCLVGEAIQQTPVMHLCEPNEYIKKWEQQDLSNAIIQTKTKEPLYQRNANDEHKISKQEN
jgi:hypothetical protein